MGLIQDSRPRDWAYLAMFHPDDLQALQEMVKHIRETHDVDMIERFNSNCERILQGHKGDYGAPVPTQVLKTDDLVVNAGIQQCINIILGTSTARWSHFGSSVGGTNATVSDTTLQSENFASRVTFAWAEPVGMRMYFGAISSQSGLGEPVPAAPIAAQQIGIFNSSGGGTMLNRSVFADPADYPNQQSTSFGNIYTAPIIFSSVIEFCPVA